MRIHLNIFVLIFLLACPVGVWGISLQEIEEIEEVEKIETAQEVIEAEEPEKTEEIEKVEEIEKIEPIEEIEATEKIAPTEETEIIEQIKEIEEIEPIEEEVESLVGIGEIEEIKPLEGEEKPSPTEDISSDVAEEKPSEEKIEEKPTAPEIKEITFWNDKIKINGVAMARAVMTGDEHSPFTRYHTSINKQNSETLYDIAHIGLALTVDINPDWQAYSQIGWNPRLPDKKNYAAEQYHDDGKVSVFETYVRLLLHSDHFKQPFYLRAGRIAPFRFSREHIGPLRTSEYFATPSPISTFLNNIYGWGIDVTYGFAPGKNPLGGWAFGVMEGNRFYTLPFAGNLAFSKHYWAYSDTMSDPSRDNSAIVGRPGFYAYAEVRDATSKYRLSGMYYHNGVRHETAKGFSLRVASAYATAEWKYATLICHYINGETLFREPLNLGGFLIDSPMLKFDGFYVLLHIPIKKHHDIGLRLDDFTVDYRHKDIIPAESFGYALNYTYKFKKHHKFSAEYIILDTADWDPLGNDPDDDQFVINYTFAF